MTRKNLLLALAGVQLCLLTGLMWNINKKSELKAQVIQQIQSVPPLTIPTLQGEHIPIQAYAAGQPFLLIYFNSTCDICKITLNALNTRISEFEEVAILLASNQLKEELESTLVHYPSLFQENVRLLIDEEMHLSTYLGVRSVPSIFCYDGAGSLIASYQGPVKLDILLDKLLNREGEKL
ncbi:MAG: TlpA family protein disulfide reductase [Cecembia sp.]